MHHTEKLQLNTDNIAEISELLNANISEKHLIALKRAGFTPVGAIRKKAGSKECGLIVFKNDMGEKISICFLPKEYALEGCHKINVIGIPHYDKWSVFKGNEKIDEIGLPASDRWTVFKTNDLGTPFECGQEENCNFAYLKKEDKTLAIISDDFSDLQMIDFVMPLRKV
jgi:hypothetical protein